ncbi:MAG TPA: emp24/gp25L/p24 family protein [Dehalococcoidia bacterium]|jgi:hypothetical protein|nr:emp24/gp25L/p24 family protein [Dehalococcoidia bacterium]
MRTFIAFCLILLALGGLVGGGWAALTYWQPGHPGTPSHAGAVSNGQPGACTNHELVVRARAQTKTTMTFEQGDLVRGTFEANGGFGRVDVLMRVTSPLGDQLLQSARRENYDFSFPVKYRGEYDFVFDNRYSMLTSKAVALYVCIDHSGPRPQPPAATLP